MVVCVVLAFFHSLSKVIRYGCRLHGTEFNGLDLLPCSHLDRSVHGRFAFQWNSIGEDTRGFHSHLCWFL